MALLYRSLNIVFIQFRRFQLRINICIGFILGIHVVCLILILLISIKIVNLINFLHIFGAIC